MFLPPWIWRIIRSRRTKIALFVLPTLTAVLIVTFYAIANWRGQEAIEKHRQWLRSKGYATTPEEYYQPASNPENDVMRHPAMIDELGRPEKDRLDRIDPRSSTGRFTGLATKRPKPKREAGERLNAMTYFDPVRHPNELAAARELLDGLASERNRVLELNEALTRPELAWPLDFTSYGSLAYTQPTGFLDMMRIATCIHEVGVLHLAAGEVEEALEAEKSLRLIERHFLKSKVSILSCVISRLVLTHHLELIHEGVCRGAWSNVSLEEFELHLRELDPQKSAVDSVSGESTFFETRVHLLARLNTKDLLSLPKGWNKDRDIVVKRLRGFWWSLRPHGLALVEHANATASLVEHGSMKNGTPRRRFDLADANSFRQRADNATRAIGWTGTVSSGMESLAIEDEPWLHLALVAENALLGEAALAVTRTGIALERHRLTHGHHPADLAGLIPEFLSKLPIDPYDEEVLRYKRLEDGSPIVWSIGPDGIDQGGAPEGPNKSGDRVWRVRPPDQ